MQRNGPWPLRIVDILCGCVVAACVSTLVWYTLIREDRTEAEIQDITGRIHSVRRDTRRLRAEGQRYHAMLATYREELAETGQLPSETPLEEYFQALSALSSDHGLRVMKHQPLAPREYTGLREQRYSYEVSGPFPQLVAFLKSIENTDFWADVSYLKLDAVKGRRSAGVDESEHRTVLLTISLFSAPPQAVPKWEGT